MAGTRKALTPTQVKRLRQHLDRIGEGDLQKGTCRKVAPGVEICRIPSGGYFRMGQRAGSTKAMRRADAKRGIRYL